MMLIQLFNEQLATLPIEKKRLLTCLSQLTSLNQWDSTKAIQATKIVSKEHFEPYLNYFTSSHYSTFSLKPMKHFFSFEECSINNADVDALWNYVQSLLDDLNKLSNVIQFSLAGAHTFNSSDGGRTFEVVCTF